jgi:gliding motility-associated-like protein
VGSATPFTDGSTNPSLWGWDFGDGGTGTTQNPTHTYTTAGTFNVTLIVTDSKGCTASVTKPVTVNALPNVDFSDSLTGCSPLPVTFTNLSDPGTYQWDLGNGTTSTANPSTTYINTTQSPVSYTISLTVTDANGCKASLTKPNYITVYPNPLAEFTMNPTQTEILYPNIDFFDQSTGSPVSWLWTFGDGDSSTQQNPSHSYKDTGTYNVCLTIVNAWGCPSTVCHPVVIKPIWTFYIPNAFTPDGDGKNDFFNGKGYNITEYQLWIFDRWGDLIYTTGLRDNPESSIPWDGRANGGSDIVQEDVYVYLVKLKDVFGKKHRYVGSVTVVK